MGNLYFYYAEGCRFDSLYGRLRAMQHYGCNKWLPTCQWLASTVEGRFDLVKWGSTVAT